MTAFRPLPAKHFECIDKQIEGIQEEKSYLNPKHLKTLEIYDNQIKICKLERWILTTFNSDNKNRLILGLLKKRYTELSTEALDMYENAVKIGELTEGEYIKYATQWKEGDKALGKICQLGMEFCQN